MIVKGFITEVGQTRSWTDKDGGEHLNVKLTLSSPYTNKQGEEHEDVLMCEMNIPNEDYLKVLQNACASHERYEFQLGFYLSDWNGKKIQNIKLYNASKPL